MTVKNLLKNKIKELKAKVTNFCQISALLDDFS